MSGALPLFFTTFCAALNRASIEGAHKSPYFLIPSTSSKRKAWQHRLDHLKTVCNNLIEQALGKKLIASKGNSPVLCQREELYGYIHHALCQVIEVIFQIFPSRASS